MDSSSNDRFSSITEQVGQPMGICSLRSPKADADKIGIDVKTDIGNVLVAKRQLMSGRDSPCGSSQSKARHAKISETMHPK